MKKATKIIAGVACLAAISGAAFGMTACDTTKTYTGEYSYDNQWETGKKYGVKVSVTVDGDNKITAVTVEDDTDTFYNASPSWTEGTNAGDLGHDKALSGLNDYINAKIIGKDVATVKALVVATQTSGEPKTDADSKAAWSDFVYTGATQTSGRLILAIQDALKDVK
jgi:hypothetical protein